MIPEDFIHESWIDLAVEIGCCCRRNHIPDKAVWDLARTMDRVFRKHRRRIVQSQSAPKGKDVNEHPAFQHLLDVLFSEGGDDD